jgi:hypothetical protein
LNLRERYPTSEEAKAGKAAYARVIGFASVEDDLVVQEVKPVAAQGTDQLWIAVPRYVVAISLPNSDTLINSLKQNGYRTRVRPQADATAERSQAIWLGVDVPFQYSKEILTMAITSHPELQYLDRNRVKDEIFLGGDPSAARKEGCLSFRQNDQTFAKFKKQLSAVNSQRDIYELVRAFQEP